MNLTTDRSPVDYWTIVHSLWGFIGTRQGLTTTQVMLVSTLYELVEDRVIEQGMKNLGWTKEAKHNALVDILAAYIGSEMAK